jgi:hypothetical protein
VALLLYVGGRGGGHFKWFDNFKALNYKPFPYKYRLIGLSGVEKCLGPIYIHSNNGCICDTFKIQNLGLSLAHCKKPDPLLDFLLHETA